MKVEAKNLQEAFQKAADKLECSVTQLDIQVIQHPSSGILGLFKKSAIIEAYKEGTRPKVKSKEKRLDTPKAKTPKETKKFIKNEKLSEKKTDKKKEEFSRRRKEKAPMVDINIALPEIKAGMEKLIASSCFDVQCVNIEPFNDETVLLELNGQDAALLIGKEGYRYKALSYLLYNWINMKYGLGIRLEIAEFLKNQELMIEKYLIPVIERIENNGRGQTKPLDGVLIKIALERLRNRFPQKYVGIKTGREGVKFIVVNSFTKKQ